MDANKCQTLIQAARESYGRTPEETCAAIHETAQQFGAAARAHFGRTRQWG